MGCCFGRVVRHGSAGVSSHGLTHGEHRGQPLDGCRAFLEEGAEEGFEARGVGSEGVEVGAEEVACDLAAVTGGESGECSVFDERHPVLEGAGVPAEGCAEEGGVAAAVERVRNVRHEEVGVDAGSSALGAVAAEGFEHCAVDLFGRRRCAVEMAVGEFVLAYFGECKHILSLGHSANALDSLFCFVRDVSFQHRSGIRRMPLVPYFASCSLLCFVFLALLRIPYLSGWEFGGVEVWDVVGVGEDCAEECRPSVFGEGGGEEGSVAFAYYPGCLALQMRLESSQIQSQEGNDELGLWD